MDFTGRYTIPATPETVWDAIQNPAVLQSCIPGCESLEKTADNVFEARATLKIGPVKATFKGKVTLDEMEPTHRCVLRGEGQGGVAGFAKGEAEVLLTPDNGQTVLTYTAKANVGGKLAQIGQRLIDGAARQIADDFFTRFSAAVSAPPLLDAVKDVPPEIVAAQPVAGAALVPSQLEGISTEIWVVGLVAVVIILLLMFGLVL
ncbi:MAG TPA: carbon monoxide dehydrogenase subunit G [Rhizomicrobium sp.]|nr:carbon monoxide dehydrogenase subunit G [Rhizomicrobium sp.]